MSVLETVSFAKQLVRLALEDWLRTVDLATQVSTTKAQTLLTMVSAFQHVQRFINTKTLQPSAVTLFAP